MAAAVTRRRIRAIPGSGHFPLPLIGLRRPYCLPSQPFSLPSPDRWPSRPMLVSSFICVLSTFYTLYIPRIVPLRDPPVLLPLFAEPLSLCIGYL